MSALPEPTSPEPAEPEEGLRPVDDGPETFTPEALLAIARTQAGVLDPKRRALYASLPSERFFHAADLTAFWLVAAHQSLEDERRGRGHRRALAATTHQLAESTNDVELICALAWTHVAYAVLPGRVPRRKKRDGDER
jgi:hypothetical protein